MAHSASSSEKGSSVWNHWRRWFKVKNIEDIFYASRRESLFACEFSDLPVDVYIVYIVQGYCSCIFYAWRAKRARQWLKKSINDAVTILWGWLSNGCAQHCRKLNPIENLLEYTSPGLMHYTTMAIGCRYIKERKKLIKNVYCKHDTADFTSLWIHRGEF